MITIIIIIILFIFSLVALCIGIDSWKNEGIWFGVSGVSLIIALILTINGCFNGFINHKPTSGSHVGVLTAVDLEGLYFRRYECYLKSGGYNTSSETKSDETKYLIYDYEEDLAKQLQEYLGRTVKINYGFEGGYIRWNNCGTYHIKSVELLEEK